MSSPQEQYAETLRSSQAAVVDAVESWTKSAQSALAAPDGGAAAFDPNPVIDQVFTFAEQMLAVQREFAKTLAATAVSAGEAARDAATPAEKPASDNASRTPPKSRPAKS